MGYSAKDAILCLILKNTPIIRCNTYYYCLDTRHRDFEAEIRKITVVCLSAMIGFFVR